MKKVIFLHLTYAIINIIGDDMEKQSVKRSKEIFKVLKKYQL